MTLPTTAAAPSGTSGRSCSALRLSKHDATPLAVFHYWHVCPECGYAHMTEYARFCAGCGRRIEFYEPNKRISS